MFGRSLEIERGVINSVANTITNQDTSYKKLGGKLPAQFTDTKSGVPFRRLLSLRKSIRRSLRRINSER